MPALLSARRGKRFRVLRKTSAAQAALCAGWRLAIPMWGGRLVLGPPLGTTPGRPPGRSAARSSRRLQSSRLAALCAGQTTKEQKTMVCPTGVGLEPSEQVRVSDIGAISLPHKEVDKRARCVTPSPSDDPDSRAAHTRTCGRQSRDHARRAKAEWSRAAPEDACGDRGVH